MTGIRERVRPRKPQRVTLSSWSFQQFGAFLAYKARRAGVPLVAVDPRYTSQTCAECGHRDKRNRPNQETFHALGLLPYFATIVSHIWPAPPPTGR